MKVGSQIIEHLSKGIYTNPSQAIKELISNAYDADARKVIVRAQPELDIVTISDNGEGMNYNDFNNKFLSISRSDRRDDTLYTKKLNRPIIGKFGIGFVAVSQVCDYMNVISSKKGDEYKMEANINFEIFRDIEHKYKEFYEISEVEFINSKEEKDAHYTIINLTKLTEGFNEYLQDKDRIKASKEDNIMLEFYEGLRFSKIMDSIKKNANIYKSQFDLTKNIGTYWQMVFEIANTVPIKYMNDGPVKIKSKKYKKINEFFDKLNQDVTSLDFTIDFDGIILNKPLLLPIQENLKIGKNFDIFHFEKKFDFKDNTTLKFRGYVYNQDASIYPPQIRGIIIRIKNTAIGGIDHNFMDYLYGDKLFQNWTFGEIYVDEGLERAMNINRTAFNTADLHY